MIFNFSAIDMTKQPKLVLCSAAGTPIQPLKYAFNVRPNIHFNETSTIEFDIPAYVDGMKTPHYDDIVGMRYILWVDVGLFILNNPSVADSGMQEIKSCKANSSEFEFTFKQIFLESGTYCFYDPLDNSNTIVGRILELMPSWSVGSVDEDLWDKYRTFDDTNENVYDFMKSTIQQSYSCIIDFDTINRKIHVRSTASDLNTNPVFISLKNLAKEITVTENDDNLFTCVDVTGAEGVDIRSVNPLGTNKIYDLSYFMTEANVGAEIVEKWNQWNTAFENSQLGYFNLTVEESLQQANLIAAKARLTDLKGELSSLETLQSTYVEHLATYEDAEMQSDLLQVKIDIAAKSVEIAKQTIAITEIEARLAEIQGEIVDVNVSLAFEQFFTEEEMLVLDRYIKESSIQETTFVAPTSLSYTSNDETTSVESATIEVSGASVTYVKGSNNKDTYTFTGGTINVIVDEHKLAAKIVRGALERSEENELIMTAYLNAGTYRDKTFASGCVSIIGAVSSLSSNVVVDETGVLYTGSTVSCSVSGGFFFLTENTTEYQQRAIEWDLFDYGKETLHKMAHPTYSFSVDSGNFLSMDDFIQFRNKLSLGEKIYLELSNMGVLEPVLIGCSFDYESPDDLTLEFGDTFNCANSEFKLTDLLDQSISAGKSADYSKFTTSQWVDSGASNAVKDFLTSALDASQNAVISSSNQSIIIDQTGIRLRKWNEEKQSFDEEQIWMINNNIVFTDDNWSSAKMALGHIVNEDEGIDAWGLVADLLVGKLMAGESLVIESTKQDGGTAVFRVDADGAKLYNSQFDLVNEYNGTTGHISMYAVTGLVGGVDSSSAPLFDYDDKGNIAGVVTENGNIMENLETLSFDDLPNANFWVDMLGNAYLRGTIYAEDGVFNGTVYAHDGEFSGVVNAQDLKIDGVSISNIIDAIPDEDGDLDVLKIGDITIDGKTGEITFGGTDPVKVQYSTSTSGPWQDEWDSSWTEVVVYAHYSYDGGNTWGPPIQIQSVNGTDGKDGEDGSNASVPYYIHSTHISSVEVQSPKIVGNDVQAYSAFSVMDSPTSTRGWLGRATGKNTAGYTTHGVALVASQYNTGTSESPVLVDVDMLNTDTNNDYDYIYVDYDTLANYVIATSDGVRMQAGANRITVTPTSINITTDNGKAYYNGVEIGSGTGGDVVAVFG